MPRPLHLPDYHAPPLHEFVLGVQFSQPQGYQQIHAGEVWAIFKERYPSAQEQPALPPTFETFGLPQNSLVNFGMIAGALHDRFWFLSRDGSELLQFQNDRFLHNWRNLRIGEHKYPRFEKLIEDFRSELHQLEAYFKKFENKDLTINQCEISYTNHIRPRSGQSSDPGTWLRFLNFQQHQVDDFRAMFRRTIWSQSGKPLGRVMCEAATAFDPDGTPFMVLALTARGAPEAMNLDGAIAFLTRSREMLVNLFAEITTDSAQQIWGKA